MNFLRKHHLLKDEKKDPTPIKFTASSTFFLTRASQHKIMKIGITFSHTPNSSYAFSKIENNLKELI